MKLASLHIGLPDGELVVVSRDLAKMAPVGGVAYTMQAALDSWANAEPTLRILYDKFDDPRAGIGQPFKIEDADAVLPRAYQFLDGSAYLNHASLIRRARGEDLPETLGSDPLMYQGVSDRFLRPYQPIPLPDESWGLDFEAEIGVVVDNVPMGATAETARKAIRLLLLINDISLRNLVPNDLAKRFGFLHGKPRSALSPVAVTPDSLGTAWDGGRLHLPLRVTLNGAPFGAPHAGEDMTFDFGDLIAHAARTRPLAAGTIIGSGTVSNRNTAAGSCCIAERRAIETIELGEPKTPYLRVGDRIRIEMIDEEGISVFGAIEQEVVAA